MPSFYPVYPVSGTSSDTKAIAVTIVFGVFAAVASLVTLWQAHRLWHTMTQGAAHDEEARLPAQGTLEPKFISCI